MISYLKKSILDVFFPSFCLVCQKEGDYLCPDCKGVLEVLSVHERCQRENIDDLYFALPCQNPLIKNLIKKFKSEPFIKELGKTLSSLIIDHFNLLDNKPDFFDFILVPVPLEKRKLRWRGFNQSEEIAKELAVSLKIPLISDVLMKEKDAFFCQNQEKIKEKKILLIDDFLITGSTMKECAKALKESGAKEIIGIVVARK